jgi:hypothetical protein
MPETGSSACEQAFRKVDSASISQCQADFRSASRSRTYQLLFLLDHGRGIAVNSAQLQFQEAAMAHFERIRDVISGPFSPQVIQQRSAAGWQMVSIEWRRELPDSETPSDGAFSEDVPYGLRIAEDGQRLEVHPRENQALMLMMDLLGQDFSYSSIVSDLNEKGFRTRSGQPWSRIAVFNMMPRLIEVGPRLFASEEWKTQQQKMSRPR